jgi:hypothetical protein
MFGSLKDVFCRIVRLPTMLGTLLMFALVAFSPASAQAPPSPPVSGQTPASDDMLARIEPFLAMVPKGLDEIDADLIRVEQRARIAPGFDRIEAKMDQVAKSVLDALGMLIEATRQPDEAQIDKAKIQESYPSAFLEFENAAKGFRDRATKIMDRLLAIQRGITEGRIVIDPEVFDTTSARDRVEFMRILTPQAQDIYRRMSPAKFSGVDFHLQKFAMGFGSAVKDASVPDANAAVAAGCVGVCVYAGAPACVACVGLVGGGVYLTALDWYKAQCNCCRCRSWKPWCCICRAACWTAFAAWVA